jgi:Fe-S-cluster containining protein
VGKAYAEDMAPGGDERLIQIVDAATADAARRSGAWLKCAPGCTQCCVGVFAISQLDAARLVAGLGDLELVDPERAAAVRQRAREAVARLTPEFPGDAETGILDGEKAERFEDFANDEPCPVLDPATGLCDLYAARPMTCRVFGPPLRTEEGLGVCELCFDGASEAEIAAAEVHLDSDALEAELTADVERARGLAGSTIIAWALGAR